MNLFEALPILRLESAAVSENEQAAFDRAAEVWVGQHAQAFDDRFNPDIHSKPPDVASWVAYDLRLMADLIDANVSHVNQRRLYEVVDSLFALRNRANVTDETGDSLVAFDQLDESITENDLNLQGVPESAIVAGYLAGLERPTHMTARVLRGVIVEELHTEVPGSLVESNLVSESDTAAKTDLTELEAVLNGVVERILGGLGVYSVTLNEVVLNRVLCRTYGVVQAYTTLQAEKTVPGSYNWVQLGRAQESMYLAWKSGLAEELRFVAEVLHRTVTQGN